MQHCIRISHLAKLPSHNSLVIEVAVTVSHIRTLPPITSSWLTVATVLSGTFVFASWGGLVSTLLRNFFLRRPNYTKKNMTNMLNWQALRATHCFSAILILHAQSIDIEAQM